MAWYHTFAEREGGRTNSSFPLTSVLSLLSYGNIIEPIVDRWFKKEKKGRGKTSIEHVPLTRHIASGQIGYLQRGTRLDIWNSMFPRGRILTPP